jgi:hypothetical protein
MQGTIATKSSMADDAAAIATFRPFHILSSYYSSKTHYVERHYTAPRQLLLRYYRSGRWPGIGCDMHEAHLARRVVLHLEGQEEIDGFEQWRSHF